MDQKFNSLKEEAEFKTKKLKKIKGMIIKAESDLKDMQSDHQRAKDELLDSIRELQKEVRLQIEIIDSYIPEEFQVKYLYSYFCYLYSAK